MRNKRAFDKVQHLIVIKPLKKQWSEGNFLNLTKSYINILYDGETQYIAFKIGLKNKKRTHAVYMGI